MAGLSTLTGSITTGFQWGAQVALVGGAYSPSTNSGSIPKVQSFGTASANNAVGGADEAYSFQQGVVAGGSATVDFTGMTDLLQRVKALGRVKSHQIRLLSAADDATISPAPTASSTGTVTNIGPTCPLPLQSLVNGGSGLVVGLTTSFAGGPITGTNVAVAGSGYPPSSSFLALPAQSPGSGATIVANTNAAGGVTSVVLGFGGTGYTNASNVATVVGGQFSLVTGAAQPHVDVSAAGECLVSATQKNLLLLNNDASHAVTFEVDVFGGTN